VSRTAASPGRRPAARSWAGVGAVAVVALVLVTGAVWLGAVDDGSARPAAADGPRTGAGGQVPEAVSTAAPRDRPRVAAPPAVPSALAPVADTHVPTSAPRDVSWQVWRTLALPWSRLHGPARTEGDAVAGFSRTPTGALLASVHASARKVAAGDPGWRQVAVTMLAPGAGRDAWMAARGRDQRVGDPSPGTFAQVAGFQFVTWSPDDAVVQLVTRSADGQLGVIIVHAEWLDGDWRLVLAPDGGDATSQQRAASLAGFVAWGGV
jgi:hypothetical protein